MHKITKLSVNKKQIIYFIYIELENIIQNAGIVLISD